MCEIPLTSMESFTTAPSSLESMDLDHVMNLDYLALDSDSSSLNSWEIEHEYYEHEVKKMIYKKRAAMRQYEEGPRRKNGVLPWKGRSKLSRLKNHLL